MKKTKFMTAALSLASLISFAGCSCGGDKTVESLSIESGLDYVYYKGTDYSFDDIKVKVTWNDGSVTYVGKDDLNMGTFSTETVGTHKVTFSYKGKQVQVELKVTADADEVYQVHLFDEPTTLKDRTAKLAVDSSQDGGYASKVDTTYVVGDDNKWYFNPEIKYLDPETQIQTSFEKYTSVSTVYLKDGENFVELKETNTDATKKVSTYVAIDEENSSYDFTDAAINKTFKLVVRPANFPIGPQGQEWKEELIFRVVDGYNVHNEVELGVMTNYDNHNEDPSYLKIDNVTLMKEFLVSQGVITEGASVPDVNGIVLHKNLKLEMSHFPTQFFAEYQGEDYMLDYLDLYCHKNAPGETFTFYGNYFAVDASALPMVLPKEADPDPEGLDGYGHSQVFRVKSDTRNYSFDDENKAYSRFENVEFIGNAPVITSEGDELTEEEEEAGLRGLILYKAQYHEVTFDNVLNRAFMIGGMAETAGTILNLNNYKSFNAYQNQLFIWGSRSGDNNNDVDGNQLGYQEDGEGNVITTGVPGPVVNITNSILEKAGGPAIMSQHDYDADENEENVYPTINIDANSRVDSEVYGGEAWFQAITFAGANFPRIITMVELLQTSINGIVPNGFNFLKVEDNIRYINLHTVSMNAGDESATYVDGLDGKINYKYLDSDNEEQTFSKSLAQIYNDIPAATLMPVITSSNGATILVNPDAGKLYNSDMTQENPQSEMAKLVDCEYINIYFMGLMVTLKTF